MHNITRKAFLGERLVEVFQSQMEPNSCSRFRQKRIPIEALDEPRGDEKTSHSRRSFWHEDKADLTVLRVDVLPPAHGFWEGIDRNRSKTLIVFECFLDQ
ncbi:MAG: hypothetical protein MUC83_08690 [Pirellula sp.]|nr:hypothetical protein [Pirellula sp.]